MNIVQIKNSYFFKEITLENFLVVTFFILSLIGILNHEMWRDELQAWMIAKDSVSLLDLFTNLRYEGHPGLWHLCLFLISRITDNPISMQFFHILISTSFIYIFLKFSPFSNLQKVLFSFGNYTFYHYNIISRNYGCGILLIFLFCSLFRTKDKTYIWLGVILALLANTNAFAFILAVCLGMTLLVDKYFQEGENFSNARKLDFFISIIIFLTGIIVALIQLIPPADAAFIGNATLKATSQIPFVDINRLLLSLEAISKSYFPIIKLINDKIVITNPILLEIGKYLILFINLFTIFYSIHIFVKQRVVCFLYISGTLSILLFSYFKFLGSLRHFGHLFILFIVCLWLMNYYHNIQTQSNKRNFSFLEKHQNIFIYFLLIIHMILGLSLFSHDLMSPFSESKQAANYIKEHKLNEMLMAGSVDSSVSPIAGLLNQKIYYPESNSFGSFIHWNQRKNITQIEAIEKISQLLDKNNNQLLMILSDELNVVKPDIKISEISRFARKSTTRESFYLYLVQKK